MKKIQSRILPLFLFFIFSWNCGVPALDRTPLDLLKLRLVESLLKNQNNQVAKPSFNPEPGHYGTPENISISTTTDGATIYYTVDGSTPTTGSTVYTTTMHIWSLAGRSINALATKVGLLNSEVLNGVFSYPPLKTGQTICYDSSGTVIACVGTNQDGDRKTGVVRGYTGPTQHGTYTSDYTTTDTATGLVWKTCSQGLSGANCGMGSAIQLNWTDASDHPTNGCTALNSENGGNGYAGIKTWRLPTSRELGTLMKYESSSLTINTTAFPGTKSGSYWSSTVNLASPSNSFYSTFSVGIEFFGSQTTNYYVRCVSGLPPTSNATGPFTDNSDGTIKDNATGLVWQKCSHGQNNDATCTGAASTVNWVDAINNCNGLLLGGRVWRLPNANELKTIMDLTRSAPPYIDMQVFPGTVNSGYVTSTTYVATPANAIILYFQQARVNRDTKATFNNVRCVSGP